MRRAHKQCLGFSLIELVAVVVMMMILVSLALPRFRVFVARSRQAEAINNLGVIKKLQLSYNLWMKGLGHGDNVWHKDLLMGKGASGGTCADNENGQKNTLGFRVESCEALRYTYDSLGFVGGAFASAENTGRDGKNIYPGCTIASGENDKWQIRRNAGSSGFIRNTRNIIQFCDD